MDWGEGSLVVKLQLASQRREGPRSVFSIPDGSSAVVTMHLLCTIGIVASLM